MKKKNEIVRYRINYEMLLTGNHPKTEIDGLLLLQEQIMAIFHLLNAGKIELTEEGYMSLPDSAKKYFIGRHT